MDLPSWSQMLAADNEFRGRDWDKEAMGCAYSLGWGVGIRELEGKCFPFPG